MQQNRHDGITELRGDHLLRWPTRHHDGPSGPPSIQVLCRPHSLERHSKAWCWHIEPLPPRGACPQKLVVSRSLVAGVGGFPISPEVSIDRPALTPVPSVPVNSAPFAV